MNQQLLRPTYADQFHCIGSDCPDTCCRGWVVYVDKSTYQRYQGLQDLRPLTEQYVEINPLHSHPLKYAHIRLLPDGKCPFLTTEKLCCIHQQHGEQYLSTTCARYPRATVRIDGQLETALYLSCPEAARIVLFHPRLLPELEGQRYSSFRLESFHNVEKISLSAMVHKLRRFSLELLGDRTYPVWQRLFVMGIVCRRAQELLRAKRRTDIPQLLGQYAGILGEGSLRSQLDGIPARPDLQWNLVTQLIRCRYEIEQPDEDFAGLVAEFLLGTGYSSEAKQQGDPLVHQQALAALQTHVRPGLLENYLVNYFFRTRFPFADSVAQTSHELDPLRSCLLMLLHYRLLESLLAGVAMHRGAEFDDSQVVRVVAGFSRAVEHNIQFADACAKYLNFSELQQAEGLAVLLKN